MGKKFFLFSLFAFLAAGFGFGGVSMAACEGTTQDDNEASLTIGETPHYCSFSEAIAAANGGTVKILKVKNEGYELPATIDNPMTIETDVDGVFIKHGSNQIITTVNEDVTFKGITFRFSNDDKRYHFEQAANKTITMDNCVIDGSFYVWGDMNFKDCTFKKDQATSPASYNIIVNYGDVEFDGCMFTNDASRNVNIAWGGDDTYKVDFKNTTFTNNATDAKKAAVMIHELTFKSSNTQGYPYDAGFSYLDTTKWYKGGTENIESRRYIPGKWTVTFDANTQVLDSTKYNSNLIGESTLYAVDDIYFEGASIVKEDATKNDYANRYGTLNGGDVTVKIDGSTVYSTKSIAEASVTKDDVTTNYATLAEAIAAATSTDTVVLNKDIETTNTIVINKTLTLDLNGKDITNTSDGSLEDQGGIGVIGGTVTIKDSVGGSDVKTPYSAVSANGAGTKVIIEEGNFEGRVCGNRTNIHAVNGGEITINGGTFVGAVDCSDTNAKKGKVIYAGANNEADGNQNNHGKIIINGGSFAGRISDSNWGKYEIKGGTFDRNQVVHYNNPAQGASTSTNTTIPFEETGFLPGGYVVTENVGQNTWTVSYDPVAEIGEGNTAHGFASLRAAIAAAVDGDTITLKADDNKSFDADHLEIEINKSITIDGDGHTLYGFNDYLYDNVHDHDIFIGAVNKDITIKNLTITEFAGNKAPSLRVYPIWISKNYGGTLTLDNVTINKFSRTAINIGGGKKVIIKNSTIEGTIPTNTTSNYFQGGIEFTSPISTTTEVEIIDTNISNIGAYHATDEQSSNAAAIQLSLHGKLTVNGGTYQGQNSIILAGFKQGEADYPSYWGDAGDTDGEIIIEGGKFDGNILVEEGTSGKLTIKGGKFSVNPSTYVVAGKYAKAISEGNLKYEVATQSTSSGGGGGSSKKSETTKTDDAKANTGDTATVDDKNAEDKNDETKADEPKTAVDANNNGTADTAISFSQEFKDAYKFAHDNGITTKDSIEEADMYGPLTRIAMAKMLSQYAINVLGKTPDTTKVVPNFPDVDAQLDADYNNGVTLAYQLGIMGIGIEEFRPFDLVTRAEFGTALSRMLFGLADGDGAEWYKTHLDKLMSDGIITNDNPQLQELRGYVMIMLMRSAQ